MSGWRAQFTVPAAAVPAVEAAAEQAFAPHGGTPGLACFEIADGGDWCVELYFEAEPLQDALQVIAEAAAVVPEIERLPETDWVSASQRLRAPVTAGRFFVHGGHARGQRRAFGINLQVEAGQAFGTGAHETTRGCLLMLDRLARRMSRPQRPLDLGCGSGVLALAMARLWHRGVLASDIDPRAAEVTAENAVINAVPRLHDPRAGWGVAPIAADGLHDRRFVAAGPFDLIVANILAGPLMRMAPTVAPALAPGGRLLLAGLMAKQEPRVLAAYRARGLVREDRIALGAWPSVLLRRE